MRPLAGHESSDIQLSIEHNRRMGLNILKRMRPQVVEVRVDAGRRKKEERACFYCNVL